MTINDLKPGQSAVINKVGGEGALRQHFLDMGVIPGVEVTLIKLAPMGDPMEVRLHGYELTLRLSEAEKIDVELIDSPTVPEERKQRTKKSHHPGLGEEDKSRSKGTGTALPDGTLLTFALVGNQNSGKTTLFNQLTGARQHVGNFPGVTVDRKDGEIRGRSNTLITDLPGIYSMSPYSSEELVSRNFVLNEKPKAIINIVDATNIERNLYLTMQLLEMNIPIVVALNMMDEVTGNGGSVDINRMEAMLGVPVVAISAAKNEGVDELVRHAVHVAKYQEKPARQDFCDSSDHGGAVHRCLHAVSHLIEDHAERVGIPVRFAASKLIEGDSLILNQLELDGNEKELLEHIVLQLENERGLDRSAAIADMRFSFISKVCSECVIKPRESKEHLRSTKIDRILTGKYTAIPFFIAIMGVVFYLTFMVIGAWLQDLLALGIGWLTNTVDAALTAGHVNEAIHGLIIKGIPLDGILIQIDQCDKFRSPVHYDRLSDVRLVVDHSLDLLRIDVLAISGENHRLAATLYEYIPVLVHDSKVTGLKIAVIREGIGRSFGVLVVPYADVITLGLDLSGDVLRIFGIDTYMCAGNRLAAGAGNIVLVTDIGKQRSRLGHSVADHVRQFDLLEPLLHLRADRSSSKDELLDLATESVDHLVMNLLIDDVPDSWYCTEELHQRLVHYRFYL